VVEDACGRLTDLAHGQPDAATLLVGAVGAPLVGGAADARHEGEGAFESAHGVAERDVLRAALTDGPDHIRYRVRLEDPKVFTRPWEVETILYRRKETNPQILAYNCYGFEYEGLYP